MAQIKLTKMELRDQQYRLKHLQKYLPTLQLKKAMLQVEVNNALYEIEGLKGEYQKREKVCMSFEELLTEPAARVVQEGVLVEEVEKRFENIAGAEIPLFEKVIFCLSFIRIPS